MNPARIAPQQIQRRAAAQVSDEQISVDESEAAQDAVRISLDEAQDNLANAGANQGTVRIPVAISKVRSNDADDDDVTFTGNTDAEGKPVTAGTLGKLRSVAGLPTTIPATNIATAVNPARIAPQQIQRRAAAQVSDEQISVDESEAAQDAVRISLDEAQDNLANAGANQGTVRIPVAISKVRSNDADDDDVTFTGNTDAEGKPLTAGTLERLRSVAGLSSSIPAVQTAVKPAGVVPQQVQRKAVAQVSDEQVSVAESEAAEGAVRISLNEAQDNIANGSTNQRTVRAPVAVPVVPAAPAVRVQAGDYGVAVNGKVNAPVMINVNAGVAPVQKAVAVASTVHVQAGNYGVAVNGDVNAPITININVPAPSQPTPPVVKQRLEPVAEASAVQTQELRENIAGLQGQIERKQKETDAANARANQAEIRAAVAETQLADQQAISNAKHEAAVAKAQLEAEQGFKAERDRLINETIQARESAAKATGRLEGRQEAQDEINAANARANQADIRAAVATTKLEAAQDREAAAEVRGELKGIKESKTDVDAANARADKALQLLQEAQGTINVLISRTDSLIAKSEEQQERIIQLERNNAGLEKWKIDQQAIVDAQKGQAAAEAEARVLREASKR